VHKETTTRGCTTWIPHRDTGGERQRRRSPSAFSEAVKGHGQLTEDETAGHRKATKQETATEQGVRKVASRNQDAMDKQHTNEQVRKSPVSTDATLNTLEWSNRQVKASHWKSRQVKSTTADDVSDNEGTRQQPQPQSQHSDDDDGDNDERRAANNEQRTTNNKPRATVNAVYDLTNNDNDATTTQRRRKDDAKTRQHNTSQSGTAPNTTQLTHDTQHNRSQPSPSSNTNV